MSSVYTGGPAFPTRLENSGGDVIEGLGGEKILPGRMTIYGGLTARDYFAAKALAALIAEPVHQGVSGSALAINGKFLGSVEKSYAAAAFKLADAMLKERSTPAGEDAA